jgi:hypothetical protein
MHRHAFANRTDIRAVKPVVLKFVFPEVFASSLPFFSGKVKHNL